MIYAAGFEWLRECESGWQFGEGGVLNRLAFEVGAQVCCEVGLGDTGGGLSLGPLIERGLHFIGIDSNRAAVLGWAEHLKGKVTLIHCRVSSVAPTIEQSLAYGATPAPDVLTIDIDGPDYYVWRASSLRPAVVMVEHSDAGESDPTTGVPAVPNEWECGMRQCSNHASQANFPAVRLLAESKGYTAVAWNRCNGVYVLNEWADKLKR